MTFRHYKDNQVTEGKTIEYKEFLPSNSDSEKKEFLADVSSFANAAGGHLIFGIRETSGAPSEICGLEISNSDAEVLRLENIIRDGIEPRIPGISMKSVSLQNQRVAVIIRIQRSWALPHMVTFKGHSRFYSRNSAGKYPLDISEIRALFALSETTTERIKNFRAERLSNIVAGETPVVLSKVPKIIFHSIPIGAFDSASRFDVSLLEYNQKVSLQPLYTTGWDSRYNLDGYLTCGRYPSSSSYHSYLQVFRNGSIEAVEAALLRNNRPQPIIPSFAFEKELLDALPRLLSVQKELDVEPPLFIMLSLIGVFGYIMGVDSSHFWSNSSHPIDRDALVIPEITVDSFECDPAELLRPAFDTIWNAAGWPRSMNYDEAGKWIRK